MAILKLLGGLGVLALAACAGGPSSPPAKSAWVYYDECQTSTTSFAAMAACGKAARNSSCGPAQSCSANGNALVQYADSLVASIRSREMSEPEARRRWIEFKTTMAARERQDMAQERQEQILRSPTTCITHGVMTTCH